MDTFDLLGPLAEWLRHWSLNHEIVGSSLSIDLVFDTYSPWARFVPEMSGSLSRKWEPVNTQRKLL